MNASLLDHYRALALKRGLTLGNLHETSITDFRLLACSAALTCEAGRAFAERDVNDRLRDWLSDIDFMLDVDHVELRRWLADLGLLVRDRAGMAYRRGEFAGAFADVALALDGFDLRATATAVNSAEQQRRAAKKAAWLAKQGAA